MDYGGCHALAEVALEMPTRLRRKFVDRLTRQLEYERQEIERSGRKGRR
ncbi:MAG: hypothetical protein Q8R07_03025 [Candidatus Uhrbacteria bacterium]|nr:hypothetical protein [Candidatus Uhrbacteria bacterium]